MKTTISRLLSISLLVTAMSIGTVHSASSNSTTLSSGIFATTTTIGPNYVGPTPNLTAVANAIGLRTKSLTTQITFRPGVTVNKPVAITLDFSSPASQYRSPAQTYETRQGNRFLYNDLIAGPASSLWGRPRQMAIKATLTEGNSVYAIPLAANLDPLFDVSITPLRFKLNNNCDRFGNSEIRFSYRKPDGQMGKKNFSTSKGKSTTITEFAWSAQEASTSANLFWPNWAFYESDPAESGVFVDGFGPATLRLLPAPGGFVGRTMKSWHGQSCYADTMFDINTSLRAYSSL